MAWLPSIGVPFPVDVNDQGSELLSQQEYFNLILLRFADESPEGRDHKTVSNIGFIDGKQVFMKFSAKSKGGIYDPYSLKNPWREKWQSLLDTFNEESPPGVNNTK